LADRRVLGILAGTVTVLVPGFLILAYLPAIMRTAGTWIVIATLVYGAGQVTGTVFVPRLIQRRGARTALQLGACGVTIVAAVLTATRTLHPLATVTMAALGLAVGLTIVPQQHRLFTTVPALAPVAVGLNGSAIYIASALGAAAGGLALTLGGTITPTITAALIGLLAVAVTAFPIPRRAIPRALAEASGGCGTTGVPAVVLVQSERSCHNSRQGYLELLAWDGSRQTLCNEWE
jgi:predicted MFS family arabinose efflux permease